MTMAEDDKTTGPTIPSLIEFDPKLLEAWFEIPGDEPLNIPLPRATIDMLFDGVHRSLQANLDMLQALQNLALGVTYDVEEFNRSVAPNIVEGMNSIRRFAMVAMALKTGLKFGPNLQVVQDEPTDGE